MAKRPGGELATRPLHFIWIADCSGSMSVDGKIQSLNTAIREALPHMRAVADENPNAEVLVRSLAFGSGAQWQVSQPTPVADFKWTDLQTNGLTDMGLALRMVAEQLQMPPMTDRALPPVLVLISDGQPTDDFTGGLAALMQEPWGKKAVRIAIAIGEDADTDEVLQRFIGHPEVKPLQANNPETLVRHIKWVSTDGEVGRPLPPDARLMGNETTSLCAPRAADEVRVYCQTLAGAPPALILAASDGYANAFRDDDGFRQVAHDLWAMLRDEGEAGVKPHLRGWLDEASRQGSGDDISVGILWRVP